MGLAIVLAFGIGLFIFGVYCNCRIAKRLGYDSLTGLLLAVPIVNIFVWAGWALNESPIERTMRLQRGQFSRDQSPKVAEALDSMSG
jgi:hypothetical protein